MGMRNERIDLITKSKKNEIFWSKQIVIPAFYRDMKSNTHGGGETSPLNTFYTKLIRYASMLKDRNMFDFSFHNLNYNMQMTMVEIYDYFKIKLEKKTGLFRRYLMGKNIDYCTRTVISGPTFHANTPSEMKIDFDHCGVPISQVCSLCYPYILAWVKNFFEQNVINQQTLFQQNPETGKLSDDQLRLENPDAYFTEKYFTKKIDQFVKGPETRFEPIEVPVEGGQVKYLSFSGRRFHQGNTGEEATIINRKMTWTDILFMAAEEVTRGKHIIVTRYPVSDVYGIFIAKIRVISTQETMPMQVGDRIYEYYPVIDSSLKHEKVTECFIESCQFSNSYLPGLNGD